MLDDDENVLLVDLLRLIRDEFGYSISFETLTRRIISRTDLGWDRQRLRERGRTARSTRAKKAEQKTTENRKLLKLCPSCQMKVPEDWDSDYCVMCLMEASGVLSYKHVYGIIDPRSKS